MSFGARPLLRTGLAPQDDEAGNAHGKGGWVYILLCADRSFYVGSTSYARVEIRVAEHNEARYFGYTASRRPVRLAWAKRFDDLRDAHAAERRLKGWSRAKKEALIAGDEEKLKVLSKRRSEKAKRKEKPKTRLDLTSEFYSTGARHPEARPGAKRKEAPKDE